MNDVKNPPSLIALKAAKEAFFESKSMATHAEIIQRAIDRSIQPLIRQAITESVEPLIAALIRLRDEPLTRIDRGEVVANAIDQACEKGLLA